MAVIPITFDEPMYSVSTMIWNGEYFKVMSRKPDDWNTAIEIAQDFTRQAQAQTEIEPRIRQRTEYYQAEFTQHEIPFIWITVDKVYEQWQHGSEVWHVEKHEL